MVKCLQMQRVKVSSAERFLYELVGLEDVICQLLSEVDTKIHRLCR